MNKNKILYRPRTADPSTLTTDNLLTLANIITTSRLDHHCPPSLGVLTSVQITILYLQENIRQQALAGIFGTSQPTISRAINTVLNILEAYSAAGEMGFGWWLVEHYLPYHVNCPDGCGLGEPTRGR